MLTIGAALISPREVKKIFAADLNGNGYIVIEVGVFPLPGQDIDLSPGDFMLLTEKGRVAARPVDPASIAGAIGRDRQPALSKRSDIYTTTGITVARVPAIDPATGRRNNTTIVGTEEDIGIGAPPPAPATQPNRGAIEQELWEKSLPDGKTAVSVAGYLYFSRPSKKSQSDTWELIMDGPGGRAKLSIASH